MDKYAGYLYCRECGQKLYLHRAVSIKPEKYSRTCGNPIVICFTFQSEQNTTIFSMLLTDSEDTQKTA